MAKPKWEYRDVSSGLRMLRDFLLGRKHIIHGRFPPMVSPRTIPPPDIPRGPEYKYSKQYYYARSAYDSVLPPVIAPVAEGPPIHRDPTKKAQPGGIKPESVCFNAAPTPGPSWWWDGHSYYECVSDPPPPPLAPCPQPQCPPPKCQPTKKPC